MAVADTTLLARLIGEEALATLVSVAGGISVYIPKRPPLDGPLAELQRRAAEEAARRLAAAQAAEAAAVRTLQATKARLAATEKRLKESLYALPTAQSCGLSAAARGLLNARLAAGDDLSESAGVADRAAAGSSADSGVSEAELGAWIAEVASRYDECRARIDAIRQWDEVTHGR